MKIWALLMLTLGWSYICVTQTLNLSETSPYPVARVGLNLGYNDYYQDYLLKNWTAGLNPGFQPLIYGQTIGVAKTGTTTTFTGINVYDQVTANFWAAVGTFSVSGGSNVGCTGTITANTTANQSSQGVTYTISPACPHAFSEFDVVDISFPKVATSTANINAGNLGWQVSLSGGTITSDTTPGDLPPPTSGFQPFQVLKLTATGSNSVSLNTVFDTTSGVLYYNAQGVISDCLQISVVSGSPVFTFAVQREASGGFSNSQTVTPSGTWNTYCTTFTTSETTSQAPGIISMTYSMTGGTALIVNSQISENNDNNGTAFRNQVASDYTAMNVGEIRFWEQQNGETLLNWITPQGYRSPALGTGGVDYATAIDNATFQTGLDDDLAFAAAEGIPQVWITAPVPWSTTDAKNLADYLGGNSGTTYGAMRIALGHTTPWTSVFKRIVIEDGNEVWNGAAQNQNIPYGGGGSTGWAYIPRLVTWCAAIKADANWNPSVEKCAGSFQTGSAYYASQLEAYDTAHAVDIQANNEYGGYSITTATSPDPWVSSSTEAWGAANDLVNNVFGVTFNQSPPLTGQYEWQHGDLASPTGFTQTTVKGFGEGEGYAAMVDFIAPLWVGWKFHALDHDFFTYSQPNFLGPSGLTENIWGVKTGVGGAYNNLRPFGYGMQVANNCIGSLGTGFPNLTWTSAPTYSFPGYNDVPAESPVPYLQAFSYAPTSTTRCVAIANVDPTSAHSFSIGGTNAPAGTVNVVTLTAPALTTNNEGANGAINVQPAAVSEPAPSTYNLPAHSAMSITWTVGGSSMAPITIYGNLTIVPNSLSLTIP